MKVEKKKKAPIRRRRVAVFCSSATELSDDLLDLAYDVGQALAREGFDIVWGGWQRSSMGAVAEGVQDQGGAVHGIVLASHVEKDLHYRAANKLEVAKSFSHRIERMRAEADAFLILPGGVGTMHELFNVLDHEMNEMADGKRVGRVVIVYNHRHFYDHLRTFIISLAAQGLVRPQFDQTLRSVSSLSQLIGVLNDRVEIKVRY